MRHTNVLMTKLESDLRARAKQARAGHHSSGLSAAVPLLHVLHSTVVKSSGVRNAAGSACGQSPPCVSVGQERSQIVGKQAPPRLGMPMLSRSSSGVVPSKSRTIE